MNRSHVIGRSIPLVCIGASNIDFKYYLPGPVVYHTSNPVTSTKCYGGVARNVAENLGRLNRRIKLISFIGEDDAEADAMMKYTRDAGVAVDWVQKISNQATGKYIAILDQKRDLVIGLADMQIYDEISWNMLQPHLLSLPKETMIFSDTALSVSVLREMVRYCAKERYFLALDLVSVAKAKKIPKDLTGVQLLIGNVSEIESVIGDSIKIKNYHDYTRACGKLLERGAKHVIMTLGSEGLYYMAEDEQVYFPAKPSEVVDVTGVGDSLIAGVLYAISEHRKLLEAISYGIAAALITLKSSDTVSKAMSQSALDDQVREIVV